MPPVNSVQELKRRFNRVVRDQRVTAREAEGLIRLVKDGGGVTHSERRHFREQFILNKDLFEPAARERMQKFIDEEIPGLLIDEDVVVDGEGLRDLPDPEVMNDDKGKLDYQWVRGRLFIDGASKDDVVQGYIGDCYFAAGIAAVAGQNPQLIRDAIRENGDGTYTVRFFEPRYSGEPRKVEVTVDGQLPTRFGGIHYGKGKNRSELWVAILEKAYAQYKGGYEAIGNGGSAGDVMAALTGRMDEYRSISPRTNSESLFDQIRTALEEKRTVAAGTHGDEEEHLYAGTGIYADHAYSIHGVSEENGVKYVHLRNPWGEVEPAGNGPDDGNFKLDLATFQKLYASLYVS